MTRLSLDGCCRRRRPVDHQRWPCSRCSSSPRTTWPGRSPAVRRAPPPSRRDHALGLNRPILDQYGSFIWRSAARQPGLLVLQLRAGDQPHRPAVPVTLSLVIGGAISGCVIGVTTGVLAATHPRSFIDRAATFFALFFYSMPTFLLGVILLYVLFFRLHLAGIDSSPAAGTCRSAQNPLQWAQHLILPWMTMALTTAATYTRLTRGRMLDVLGEDYIRTARAKGVSESRIIYRHAPARRTDLGGHPARHRRRRRCSAARRHRERLRPARPRPARRPVAHRAGPAGDHRDRDAGRRVRGRRNFVVDLFYAVLDPRVRAH